METKKVTYKHLHIGQKIMGVQNENERRMFTAFVKSVNVAYVTIELWEVGGREERIDASCMFEVELTEEEFKRKYREKAKEVLTNIENKLLVDEMGSHEMWNAWLYGTPYEIAAYCTKEKMKVIGHSTGIIPKKAMFSGDTLDIGVCAEYEDGEKNMVSL